MALALTVQTTVQILVFDSKLPEMKALAKSVDPAILADLAAFAAWALAYVLVH